MRLEQAVRAVAEPALKELVTGFQSSELWTSLAAEARPFCVSTFLTGPSSRALVVVSNHDRALQWQARLALCGVPKDRIVILPSGLSSLFEDAAPETIALSDRIGALRRLASGEPVVVIATTQAALERTLPPDLIRDSLLSIKPGEEHDGDDLMRKLLQLGFERAEPVRVPGQFSRRGGILDVFPMGADRPIRIEFFGDEIDSLRTFDPMTQRSIGRTPEMVVGASRETLFPEDLEHTVDLIERAMAIEAGHLGGEAADRLHELVEADMEALRQRSFFNRLDLYRPLLFPDSGCAADILGEDGLLILDEPLELDAQSHRAEEELAQALEHRAARGEILSSTANDYLLPASHLHWVERRLGLTMMNAAPDWLEPQREREISASSLEPLRGQPAVMTQAIRNWREQGVTALVSTDQPSRAKAMLNQVELFPVEPEDDTQIEPGLLLLNGNLAGGFIWESHKVAVLTDHELFGVGRLKLPQRKFSEGVPITSVLDLKPGDYVVHISFGIGVYNGLVRRTVDGVEKEYLHLKYKEPDQLYVPADQLDRVQKYLSPEEAPPKVNRLTGTDWQKTVRKAREEAREFARELIQLYAQRKDVHRPAFGPDTPWQAEMETTFPWVETPSQLEAIHDVKADMQTDYPMDRLVCGDVGFGKTEVAIRAAFKAAQDGRQTAVLCPTTILSEQHYRSFKERLASFPTKLALINRFRTAKERRLITEGLEAGEIDIVIGTHALLASDLKFKNLGLLIIDEEQKFGVKHKESLKQLRLNVDVLTLSATPIPRTLSMALMNIRQMSVINDPPPGRLPIRTFVRPHAQEVVLEAILRELARGGQIYYVTDKVQGIQHLAEHMRKLIPSARIAVGHGQMTERELEPVMLGFIAGEIDILISTTIVESGLDIPNANTMIVENADRFGLSQLYQLRGRVGRSDRQAYAYFLYPGQKALTENASSRLSALAEFAQLGSGYSLAVRDLQIRGAGDMLGAKQSGQMSAIGYDLYSQLIEAEVEFLKTFADGERPDDMADPLLGLEPLPAIDLPVRAFLPDDYIEEQGQRLYYYKRLMGCRDRESLQEVNAEIIDRYGMPPEEAALAVTLISLRIKAVENGVKEISARDGSLRVQLKYEPTPRTVSILRNQNPGTAWINDRLDWPYRRDAVAGCERLFDALQYAREKIESERSVLSE